MRDPKRLLQDRSGTSALEYALICGLIVLVMVVGFSGFGSATRATWNTVASQMTNANQPSA
ncbi:MAG: Flp family type IVb pilin [Sphingomonadales bacterium]|nr:Flp family type IVb pilin [Sphingomonadales bacterium]